MPSIMRLTTGVVYVRSISGSLTATGPILNGDGTAAAPAYSFTSEPTTGIYRAASGQITFASLASNAAHITAQGLFLNGTTPRVQFTDSAIHNEAANTLAQRNGVNAQKFRIYSTYTDASNFERGYMEWGGGGNLNIGTTFAGTGSARSMSFQTQGSDRWLVASTGHFLAATDNAFDIGASGATRPRNYFGAGNISAVGFLSTDSYVGIAGQGRIGTIADGAFRILNGGGSALATMAALGVTASGPTSGIGYGTGAGGTVVQATSKATGVTLNTVTGEITLNAAALAANTTVSFVLTNSAINNDMVIVQHVSGGTQGSYVVVAQGTAGGANIYVRNVSAGSLAEAIVLKFVVFKAVTS